MREHHDPEAYLALTEHPEWVNRECVGDERYLADTITKRDRSDMEEVCYSCPVWARCEEYAARSNPRAGFWAGIRYPVKRVCDPRTAPA